jgi:hypothetical protein
MQRTSRLSLAALLLLAGLALTAGPAGAGAGPSNDDFADATLLPGTSTGTTNGTLVGATRQVDEPEAADADGPSVWFDWVAPTNGRVSFDTFGGSDIDTVLGIYSGNAIDSLTLLDDNDDARDIERSRAWTPVTGGVTYRIQVSISDGDDEGTFKLSWKYITRPTNDFFANAHVLSGNTPSLTGTNVGAETEVDEPEHSGHLFNSVWYRWTAPADGLAFIDTRGSDFDTVVGVYTGSPVSNLSDVNSNDDGDPDPYNHESQLYIDAVQGTTYRIAVEGYEDDNGSIRISINRPNFSDVPFSSSFFSEIEYVFAETIVNGFPDGTYRAGNDVTRAAMSAFLYRLADEPSFSDPEVATFSDVALDSTFFHEIEWMNDEGITTGFPGGLYKPNSPVTRGAMSAFMYRLAGEPVGPFPDPGFTDVPDGSTFEVPIAWMSDVEITTGFNDGTFRPGDVVTRGAMAAFMYRFRQLAF